MKRVRLMLLSALCLGLTATAAAQTAIPARPESSMTLPDDPGGMRKPRGDGMKTPSDPDAVVVPPTTGNEEITKKPRNVDPKMDDATEDIDRKNRKKSRDKAKRQ
ncbi:MAG TPA: hypothetical protein VGE12_22830 [Noviherbaspirillum sp.]